ncbi:MAG TPA: hypothetical protein VJ955_06570 [Desulfuromonadales bacterium]|nr:hypothetical protein [Desulfuromonadales bacterium]
MAQFFPPIVTGPAIMVIGLAGITGVLLNLILPQPRKDSEDEDVAAVPDGEGQVSAAAD